MGALKALPWQGTCYYDAWACFGHESMLITCMMTSSGCMMSHNLLGRRIWTLLYADRIIRLYTVIHMSKDHIVLLCKLHNRLYIGHQCKNNITKENARLSYMPPGMDDNMRHSKSVTTMRTPGHMCTPAKCCTVCLEWPKPLLQLAYIFSNFLQLQFALGSS